MFVSTNSLNSVKHYFSEQLKDSFTSREIRMMFQSILQKRLGLSSTELLLSSELKLSESDLLFIRSVVKRLNNKEPF